MTELIVAIDNDYPMNMIYKLNKKLKIQWFKLRFPNLINLGPSFLLSAAEENIKIFADLKLADTKDSIQRDIEWIIDHKIAAVSTFTQQATDVLLDTLDYFKVWQVHCLTDSDSVHSFISRSLIKPPAGVICPGALVTEYKNLFGSSIETIVPGVRLSQNDNFHGHTLRSTCEQIKNLADYAVVGRYIWQSKNPIETAQKVLEALK